MRRGSECAARQTIAPHNQEKNPGAGALRLRRLRWGRHGAECLRCQRCFWQGAL